MDLSYKREVTVGSLVILAVVLFVVGTSWLGGRSITADEDDFWKIQFQTAGNLKASSVVRISGVPVGKVERIKLVDVGKVLVMVTLPDNIVPRVDATAQIMAVGFVGDAAIEFNPGKAPQRLTRDRVITGSQAGGLTDLAETLGKRADSVLTGAQQIMNERTADGGKHLHRPRDDAGEGFRIRQRDALWHQLSQNQGGVSEDDDHDDERQRLGVWRDDRYLFE